MNGDYIFNNPQSPMMEGVKCDRCGTPSRVEDLVEQDGFLVNRTHGCYKRHSVSELDIISSEDEDEYPLTKVWGGTT